MNNSTKLWARSKRFKSGKVVTSVQSMAQRKMKDVSELRRVEKSLKTAEKGAAAIEAKKRARWDALSKWAAERGLNFLTDCPKCMGLMKVSLATKQLLNDREGGVECLACIEGKKRKNFPDRKSMPEDYISLEDLRKKVAPTKSKSSKRK